MGEHQARGDLPVDAIGLSSTRRELVGLRLAAVALEKVLAGRRVKVVMDSFPAVRNLINGGGAKQDLSAFWHWRTRTRTECEFVWIQREQNTRADELSKGGRNVNAEVKDMLVKRWAATGQQTWW